MSVFNTVLNVVVSIVFLYRPYLFCVVPDFFTDEHRQERKRKLFSKQENNDYGKEGTNSDEIPLDDVSPITCAEMVWKCVKNCLLFNHGLNVKLIIFWYGIIPVIFFFALSSCYIS